MQFGAKTMQNQSNPIDKKENMVEKFFAPTDFSDSPVLPYGKLWVDHPDTKVSWMHSHNHLEIGRCVKGSGIFNVDGKVLRVCAPCCSILYEGEWHSAQSNPYDPCEWNYLYVDLRHFLSRVDTSAAAAIKGLEWENYEFPTIMESNEYPAIASIIDAIFEESSSRNENSDEVLTGLFLALLTCHARTMKPEKRRTADRRVIERISPAVSYINAHYAENISVQTLAGVCFTSVATLRRDFIEFSGVSPAEYLHKVRIKNAAVMLSSTSKSVLEIAMDTGYPTVSGFNRQFLRAYGVSPREYRKSQNLLR